MGRFKVVWGNSLEGLARRFFGSRPEGGDPLQPECVIVGSPLQEHWLRRYFLDSFPGRRQPVLAGVEFNQIHPFVNDWMACAAEGVPIGKRDPAAHPYSTEGMQWRIWRLLTDPSASWEFPRLTQYVRQGAAGQPACRAWALAGRIARLFDDYINYRPDMLTRWEASPDGHGLPGRLAWQPALWRRLGRDPGRPSYHHLFDPDSLRRLPSCPIRDAYRRLSIFHLGSLPENYLNFFRELGTFMEVTFYAYNPCREFWIEDESLKQYHRMHLGNPEDDYYTPPHYLLSCFGRGRQPLLKTLFDADDDQEPGEAFAGPESPGTQLGALQRDLLERRDSSGGDGLPPGDASLQIHVCHSPRREVEVLHDLLLRWFEEHPDSEPRHVRVLVADPEGYAPYIDAVFHPDSPDGDAVIPSTMRFAAARPGPVAEAFLRILQLPESDFSIRTLQDLLELEPVQRRLDVSREDCGRLAALVRRAGILWGDDPRAVRDRYGKEIPALDHVTWRHGLDKMLAGLALGQAEFAPGGDDRPGEVLRLGELPPLTPCAEIEGDDARLLERLCLFHDLVRHACACLRPARRVGAWTELCAGLIGLFLPDDEATYHEIHLLRKALQDLAAHAAFADDPEIPAELLRRILAEALQPARSARGAVRDNAVVFSPFQSMNITPARCTAVLGLGDGSFPRMDHRPAFDLLQLQPRFGDPSLRQEDRAAVLELLSNTRDRILLLYSGFSPDDNKPVPPSSAIAQLRRYAGRDRITTVLHRLHGFDPSYFSPAPGAPRFSYSRPAWEAAAATTAPPPPPAPRPAVPVPAAEPLPELVLTLGELESFFDNPARHYCRNVLQTRIPDLDKDTLDDREPIAVDRLAEYRRNQVILARLLADPDLPRDPDDPGAAPLLLQLRENGLLPPGPQGDLEYRESADGLDRYLQTPLLGGLTLQDIVAEQAAEEHAVELETPARRIVITGLLDLFPCDGALHSLYYRYTGLKGRDLCHARLRHLFGHAAGRSFTTIVLPKTDRTRTKPDVRRTPPLPRETARRKLQELAELYLRGQATPLPFTPNMSWKYHEAWRKDPVDLAKARLAAQKAWNDRYSRCDAQDPYYRLLWPDPDLGPLGHPGFPRTARTFWSDDPDPATESTHE